MEYRKKIEKMKSDLLTLATEKMPPKEEENEDNTEPNAASDGRAAGV
jgi:hypothetical protein